MSRGNRIFCMLVALLALAVCLPASAELNLWISYHFAGLDASDDGGYRDAEVLLQAALAETKTKHRRAFTLDELGQVYTALGQLDKGEQYYRDALRLKERALGRRHRDVSITLNNLADLLYIQDKTETVDSLYRRALDIMRRDQLNIEVCRSLNGLALVHNDAGEYVEAEKHLKRAIEIHTKAERRDHPYLATVLTNLGILYTNLGRYAEAEPLFKRAKYIQDTVLRDDHPDVAVRLHATASLYSKIDRRDEAVALAKRAESIRDAQAAAGNLY